MSGTPTVTATKRPKPDDAAIHTHVPLRTFSPIKVPRIAAPVSVIKTDSQFDAFADSQTATPLNVFHAYLSRQDVRRTGLTILLLIAELVGLGKRVARPHSLISCSNMLYRQVLVILLACFLWQYFVGHFATAGAFLLVFAIFMPRVAKLATSPVREPKTGAVV